MSEKASLGWSSDLQTACGRPDCHVVCGLASMRAFCNVPDARKAVTEKHLNNTHLASRLQEKNNPTPSSPTRASLSPISHFLSPYTLHLRPYAHQITVSYCPIASPRRRLCPPRLSLAFFPSSYTTLYIFSHPFTSLQIQLHSKTLPTLLHRVSIPVLYLCLDSLCRSCEDPNLDSYGRLPVTTSTYLLFILADVF